MTRAMLRPSLMILLLVMLMGPSLSSAEAAQENWSVSSGPEQAVVVELFTSQGCSSCPPADRWLSQFREQPELFRKVVPVAYHVTYWDYLGWKDPYGLSANDLHHRRHARNVGAGVYTPGVFLQGREWRNWRRFPNGPALKKSQIVGVLTAQSKDGEVTINFTPHSTGTLERPEVHITYLSNGRFTQVRAGENRGRELRHDFIAGQLVQRFMQPSKGVWQTKLSYTPPAQAQAVAVWIVDTDNRFVQATGGFLTGRATPLALN